MAVRSRFKKVKEEYHLEPYYQYGEYESDGIIRVWLKEDDEDALTITYRKLTDAGRHYEHPRRLMMPHACVADLYDACELFGLELDLTDYED